MKCEKLNLKKQIERFFLFFSFTLLIIISSLSGIDKYKDVPFPSRCTCRFRLKTVFTTTLLIHLSLSLIDVVMACVISVPRDELLLFKEIRNSVIQLVHINIWSYRKSPCGIVHQPTKKNSINTSYQCTISALYSPKKTCSL